MQLAGKAAVVTGGGRGIGRAVARALAQAGARVAVAARTERQIDEVAARLRADGHQAWALQCDVTDPQSVAAMVRAAAEHLDHVDILINNAGIAFSAPIHRQTLEEWNDVFAVNVTGTMLCTKAFIQGMVERKWGRVINIASIAGLAGAKYIAAYAASKHAVIGLTRSVAAEVAPYGVTVNAVCPGYVDTEMAEQAVTRIMQKAELSRDQAMEAILDTSPQHRLIDPREVAHAVTSLCDDDAKGINGQAIVIDGGGLLA